jgi:hypothetical protein
MRFGMKFSKKIKHFKWQLTSSARFLMLFTPVGHLKKNFFGGGGDLNSLNQK